MAIAGRLASAVGYLWLLISILSGTGVIELPENFAGSAFYAVALVFLGRALRKRVRTVGEEEGLPQPVAVPTPPILPDAPRSQPPEVARPSAPTSGAEGASGQAGRAGDHRARAPGSGTRRRLSARDPDDSEVVTPTRGRGTGEMGEKQP